MRRLAITATLMLLAPPVGSAADIRSVDFKNFSYSETMCAPEGKSVAVSHGVYERGDEDDRAYFEVQGVVYGDLTGDGADEAVVSTLCNTGGTGQFTDGLVYTMRAGKPVLLATLGVGDRADGGLYRVEIRDGILYAERFGQDGTSGACCPQFVETTPLRWNGKALVDAGQATRRIYQDFQMDDAPAPHAVKFLRGTSSATLVGGTTAGEAYRVGARAGQTLTLRLESKDATATATVSATAGGTLGTANVGAPLSLTLPVTGDYLISIRSAKGKEDVDAYYRMDLGIR